MTIATLKAESKRIVRKPCAKVRITWTDPFIDPSVQVLPLNENRVSYGVLVADTVPDTPRKWIHTRYGANALDGTLYPMPDDLFDAQRNQMAYWGFEESDHLTSQWAFPYPTLDVIHAPRLIIGFVLSGDTSLNEYPVDFTVSCLIEINGTQYVAETISVIGNTQVIYNGVFAAPRYRATGLRLTVTRWSKQSAVAKITECYASYAEEYEDDDIMYMNIMQEFESSPGTLPVGNISCNEIDLKLQNLDDRLFPGNTSSSIHTFVSINRKIEPFIGFEYSDGTKEYQALGLFWSGDWTVGDLDTGATTMARDRFEVFRTAKYKGDPLVEQLDVSIYDLLEQFLDNLKDYQRDLFWDIDTDLQSVMVPVVLPEFFEDKNYFEIIQSLVQCGLAYAYMDAPTDAEVVANGPFTKDILRVKTYEKVFPYTDVETGAEEITKRDYISKTQPANTEQLANVLLIKYKVFTEDPEDPTKWIDTENTYEYRNENSILRFGEKYFEYQANDLIQTAERAAEIAEILSRSFSVPLKDIEVSAFGDVTLRLADRLEIPEYQKHGVDNRGIFVLKKISTEYNGALRQTWSGRKIEEDVIPVRVVYQDTDDSVDVWQDTDGSESVFQDSGY